MCPSRAHILKPLIDKYGVNNKYILKWTDEMQNEFDKMRLLMAADALVANPNHNKHFDIYTDASDLSWGPASCKMADSSPISAES